MEVIQKHKFGLFDRPQDVCSRIAGADRRHDLPVARKGTRETVPGCLVLLRHLEQVIRLEEFAATGVTLTDRLDENERHRRDRRRDGPHSDLRPHAAGPATLMQSLIRAELEETAAGSWCRPSSTTPTCWSRCWHLDRRRGIWWFRRHEPTADERFRRRPSPCSSRSRDRTGFAQG